MRKHQESRLRDDKDMSIRIISYVKMHYHRHRTHMLAMIVEYVREGRGNKYVVDFRC